MSQPKRVDHVENIRFEAMSFAYGAGSNILSNVDLELPTKAFVHVTGPTGHGQATLLRLMAFTIAPTAGAIHVNGQNATEMSFEEFLSIRLAIGYSFDVGGLLANRTLRENIALPHLYHKLSNADQINHEIELMAKRFRFDKVLESRPANVSGGLRKLVCALRSMMMRPSFLVMDDPFSGLDPDTAHEFENLVLEQKKSGAIETLYFTSRDEVWAGRMGAESLWVESGKVSVRTAKLAAG